MKTNRLAISDFKARCLRLLDDVAENGEEVVITKRGVPIARVLPFNQKKQNCLSGSWSASVKINGDLASYNVADDWEAND
jgi:prevent-host-death family protein